MPTSTRFCRRLVTGTPTKVRIGSGDGSEDPPEAKLDLPVYPDTGETGETYDLELEQPRAGIVDKEALEQAATFFKEQRNGNSSNAKMNR